MYSLKNNYENIYLSVSYDFLSLIGLGKSRRDIPNGTTQRCFHPIWCENNKRYPCLMGGKFMVGEP
jgi:hypothetical protein